MRNMKRSLSSQIPRSVPRGKQKTRSFDQQDHDDEFAAAREFLQDFHRAHSLDIIPEEDHQYPSSGSPNSIRKQTAVSCLKRLAETGNGLENPPLSLSSGCDGYTRSSDFHSSSSSSKRSSSGGGWGFYEEETKEPQDHPGRPLPVIVSSPNLRCKNTMEAFAEQHQQSESTEGDF